MAIIIDTRKNDKGKSASNRKRFVDRYKRQIKKRIDESITDGTLKDTVGEIDVTISGDDITEPTFSHDPEAGRKRYVIPGNDQYKAGDMISKPQQQQGNGKGKGGNGGGGEDDFTFTLTREEFLEIYFSDMALPRFIKESMNSSFDFKMKRAGYSITGIPPRLSIKKTFERAIARKIATKATIKQRLEEEKDKKERDRLKKKRPAYLDDLDLRYHSYKKERMPIRKAVMFCLMDVSGSMGEHEKLLAKKFYLLLYLFLEREYGNIEVRFIRHTTEGQEVDEHTFFHDRETGGTMVSSGMRVIADIIKEEYDTSETNIYIAQASDGDNFASDDDTMVGILTGELLPVVQYYAYLQVEYPGWDYGLALNDLYGTYSGLLDAYKNLNIAKAATPDDIYPVLRELFKKDSGG